MMLMRSCEPLLYEVCLMVLMLELYYVNAD